MTARQNSYLLRKPKEKWTTSEQYRKTKHLTYEEKKLNYFFYSKEDLLGVLRTILTVSKPLKKKSNLSFSVPGKHPLHINVWSSPQRVVRPGLPSFCSDSMQVVGPNSYTNPCEPLRRRGSPGRSSLHVRNRRSVSYNNQTRRIRRVHRFDTARHENRLRLLVVGDLQEFDR